jgi:hypothetical protein
MISKIRLIQKLYKIECMTEKSRITGNSKKALGLIKKLIVVFPTGYSIATAKKLSSSWR